MDLQTNQVTNFDKQNQKVFEAAQMCKQRNQIVSQLNLYQFLKNQDEDALSRKWKRVDLKNTKIDDFLLFCQIFFSALFIPSFFTNWICFSDTKRLLRGTLHEGLVKEVLLCNIIFILITISLIAVTIIRIRRDKLRISKIKQEAQAKLPEHTEKVNFYTSQLQALEAQMETESVITREFWVYGETVADLIRCHRADNLKEALNLLVSDMQHYEMMQQQRIQTEQQELIKNQLETANRQIKNLNTTVWLSNWLR